MCLKHVSTIMMFSDFFYRHGDATGHGQGATRFRPQPMHWMGNNKTVSSDVPFCRLFERIKGGGGRNRKSRSRQVHVGYIGFTLQK